MADEMTARLTDVVWDASEWPDIWVVAGNQVTMQVMQKEGRLVWHLIETAKPGEPESAVREGAVLDPEATP